ncbi:MAG: VOC family protein [Thermaerobacter sp.]|nr:VOC family protein [Thermaerobacter sp.]
MLRGLDHIGIIVRDLTQAARQYQEVLGLSVSRIEDYGNGLLSIAFLPVGDGNDPAVVKVELLQPHRPGSSAWRFLQEKGEGIEHLAFRADHLDGHLARMAGSGVALWDRMARPGAEGTRIAFIDPVSLSGCLVELVERVEP